MILVDSYHGFLRIAGQLDTPCNDRNLVAQKSGQQLSMYADIEIDKGFHLILVRDSYLIDTSLIHLCERCHIGAILTCSGIDAASLFSSDEITADASEVFDIRRGWRAGNIHDRIISV